MPTFVEWLGQLAPTWLQGPGGKAMTTVIGTELDRATDLVRQAVQARFPGLAPIDGLKLLGAERCIPQAPWESDGDYAAYLLRAWDAWMGTDDAGGGAGTPAAILNAVHRVLGDGFSLARDLNGDPEAATFVQWNGRYAQLYQDMRTPIFGWLDGCLSRPTGKAFAPTDLGSTLKLWLRADMGVTQSGGNVTAWADQSGNGNDVTNVGTVPFTAASINGRPGVTLAGNNGLLNSVASPIAAGGPRTVFCVVKASSEVGGVLYCNYRSLHTQEAWLMGASGSVAGLVYGSDVGVTGNYQTIPAPTIGRPLVVRASISGAAAALATISLNGVAQLTPTQAGPTSVETGSPGFGVGVLPYLTSSFGWIGDIAEVIVCDTVLSAQDAKKVEDYLLGWYSIAAFSQAGQPGWYDSTSYWARSWLLLPTPGGVITKTDPDGTVLTLGNAPGNTLKARLNAEVMKWKGAREAYGGAWVTDSYSPRRDPSLPPGSPAWWDAQSAPVSYMVGWPPRSLDPNHVLGDGFMLDGISSLYIAPS